MARARPGRFSLRAHARVYNDLHKLDVVQSRVGVELRALRIDEGKRETGREVRRLGDLTEGAEGGIRTPDLARERRVIDRLVQITK